MDRPSIDHIKGEIAAGRLSLPGKLAALAHWTFEHPADVAFGTTLSLARQCDVPQSTVHRLAATLGFKGFRQMKAAYQVHAARQAAQSRRSGSACVRYALRPRASNRAAG